MKKTPLPKIVKFLRENGYLTESGVTQINALKDVRNLIVHGNVSVNEDNKLAEWIELAYNLYSELYKDISGRSIT